MAILKYFSSLLLLTSSALAFPALMPRDVDKPSRDPWYQPPAGYQSKKPGEVLRFRPTPYPIALLGEFAYNIKASYQIQYRSTDTFGNASWGITTLMVPHKGDGSKVVSYQTAEDSACVDCAPSYAFQKSASKETLTTQVEILLMAAALEKGYYVVTPDYLGPKSAFTAGHIMGKMTLDGIRATLNSGDKTGVASDATVVMWGYSGGALASGWAAQLQPTYAPELQIAGAALGGTTPNIINVLNSINKGLFAGLAPAGIMGLAAEYPELVPVIEKELRPETAEEFKNTVNLCEAGDAAAFAFKDIYGYFKDPQALYGPVPSKILAENNMGNLNPTIPLFVYKSIPDEVSPVKDTDKMVQGWCDNGVDVQYVKDIASEHVINAITGAPEAFMWIIDRMKGKAIKKGCSEKTTLSQILKPGALPLFGSSIFWQLCALLTKPLTPLSIV